MYEVYIEKRAERDLKSLSPDDFYRMVSHIKPLAEDSRPYGCRKITGSKSDWRIRVGNDKDLEDRTFQFAVRVIKFLKTIKYSKENDLRKHRRQKIGSSKLQVPKIKATMWGGVQTLGTSNFSALITMFVTCSTSPTAPPKTRPQVEVKGPITEDTVWENWNDYIAYR